ncbi:aminoglycoside phosphotransferase family protein [Occultella glacieicola]|uniref:Aminoglycoside phosphotransferase family protein n=1 Tax=Occultella glacieicola TaxID=2518684 RepID=A0ABY2E898_9MICO|nr:aminoglycoside phosphotransferase family protein [Occultella glacieicola]
MPLLGGDVSDGLVRKGATVRRPRGAHSPAVEAYLRHLEAAGFDGAPRFLGVDAAGREVLTFVEGRMGGRPPHRWAVAEDVLVDLAVLQRRLHDVSVDVALPDGVAWPERIEFDGVPPVFEAPDVIGHNDITIENVIFERGRPVAVIDFDLAGPSTRLLDVATSLRYWAPVAPPELRHPALADVDAGRRIRIFAEAYGLDRAQRLHLPEVLDRRFTRSYLAMEHAARTRGGGWARMWDEGAGGSILAGRAWLREQREALSAALR